MCLGSDLESKRKLVETNVTTQVRFNMNTFMILFYLILIDFERFFFYVILYRRVLCESYPLEILTVYLLLIKKKKFKYGSISSQ